MEISFAIITDGSSDHRIEEIIRSIELTGITTYEIVIVGGPQSTIVHPRARHVVFDETVRSGWITAKKNLATREARFDTVVYLHDYFVFDQNWHREMIAFGTDFDVQVHRILTINGHRMFDWLTLDHPVAPIYSYVPYERSDCVPYQYISGGYWVARRAFMLDHPLDERLGHHQCEDVEWSKRIRDFARIRMNAKCVVQHNKIHRDTDNAVLLEARPFQW